MAQLQEPEGPSFLYLVTGWNGPRVSTWLGLRTYWLDSPVSVLLGIALAVSLAVGSIVYLGFQVKFWLKLASCCVTKLINGKTGTERYRSSHGTSQQPLGPGTRDQDS